MIERADMPGVGVDGYRVGDPGRLAALPAPVPADRVDLVAVDAYLRDHGLDPAEFRSELCGRVS